MAHSPDQPSLADQLLERLIPALIRAGDIAEQTVLDLADQLDHEAQCASIEREEELTQMATTLRLWAIEAAGPKHSDWQADRRRKGFRVIKDGPET